MIQEDCNKNFLLDVTPRLMDDAFVVLSNICAQVAKFIYKYYAAFCEVILILFSWIFM